MAICYNKYVTYYFFHEEVFTMKGKRFVAVVITCLLVLVSSVTALAASSDQRVRQVEITVTNDKGTVAFASHEPEKYDVLLVDSDDFDIGDEEIYFDVKAVAKNGYYFDDDHVSVKFYGDKSGVKRDEIDIENSGEVSISITIRAIAGDLEEPGNAWWSYDYFGLAEWDEVDGADKYIVRVNRDQELTVYDTSVDLRPYLRYGKNNYFEVRADSNVSVVDKSSWCRSDDLDLRGDDWEYQYYDYNWNWGNNYGPSHNNNANNHYRPGSDVVTSTYTNVGTWVKKYDGYWYFYDKYNNQKTGWQLINNCWYYLQPGTGRMLTGWQYINNHWYYMQASGEMLTGWQFINGYWYYMQSSGEMLTGLQYINGEYYYLAEYEAPVGHMVTGWYTVEGKRRFFSTVEAPVGHMYRGVAGVDNYGNYFEFRRDGTVR